MSRQTSNTDSEIAAESRKPSFELPTAQVEARAFWRMRWQLINTSLKQKIAQSRFRLSLIIVLSALLWAGLFWLFADGFRFIEVTIRDPDTRDETIRAVFGMFFAALMLMLIFSSGIIAYSGLFRAKDITFLLTLSARIQRVFLYKFQETILLSSWAFVLLGSPMLLAYGVVAEAPWYYYAMLAPFLVAFVYIPAGIGIILCLVIVRWIPQKRIHLMVFGAALLLGLGVWLAWTILSGSRDNLLTPDWFQNMLSQMSFTERQLLPSWWLSSGLLETGRHEWSEGMLFLTLMISNALFFRQLALAIAGRLYHKAYNGLHSRRAISVRATSMWPDRLIERLIPLPLEMRLLILKDLKLFRRDPIQWSQFFIFFGLLALYFLNVRRLTYDVHYTGWVHMVSFLNLLVVGLILSTFTTRFIFPMISLEGRRFWILGLLPIKRETILWSKFLFSAGGSIVPCAALVLLSDVMLRVSRLALISHQLTCVILCVGLAGIATGLGAKMPSLREESPSKIAAGFGGTLNLVVSAIYILLIVMLTALPCHFYLAAEQTHAARLLSDQDSRILNYWLCVWMIGGTSGSLILGAIATVLPLRMGFRAFRKLEF